MGYIIDISSWQDPNKINYDKLAKQLDFAIIRTQYGSKLTDKAYKTHHKELQKRGIATSAYAWVRGINIKDMEQEATDFYNRTKEFEPVIYFLDVEEKSMSDMRAGVSAYVKKLRQLGAKKIGIYIGHHLYKSFNLNLKEADVVWIPHYGKNTGKIDSKPKFPCDIHQYTSKGKLDGYSGNLDLNRLMDTLPLDYFLDTPKPEKPKVTKIKEDGKWNGETTKALQKALGTVQDGYLSKQHKNSITKALYGNVEYGKGGSMVIRALQKKIGAKVDGILGPETITKLQKYLGTIVDGKLSRPSMVVKEMQRRLNLGTF